MGDGGNIVKPFARMFDLSITHVTERETEEQCDTLARKKIRTKPYTIPTRNFLGIFLGVKGLFGVSQKRTA